MKSRKTVIVIAALWVAALAACAAILLPDERARGARSAAGTELAANDADDVIAGARVNDQPSPKVEKREPQKPAPEKPAEPPAKPSSIRATWTGAEDSRYDNPKNWEGGAPGSGADITVRNGTKNLELLANASVGSVTIESGASLSAGRGTLTVSGDWDNSGSFKPGSGTVVFSGANQIINGNTTFKNVRFTGGTKRLTHGTTLTTDSQGSAKKGEAAMVVEAGSTLVIEKGATWKTPNAYGFSIGGTLIIDGGSFICEFTNGGTNEYEDSWLEGSALILRDGLFKGVGDASFAGASITIQGGSLEINDDIWDTGNSLDISGGSMRNTTGGGMFALTGKVAMTGGKLSVGQSSSRGLRIGKETSLLCTGGEIEIRGRDVTQGDNGIVVGTSATIYNLTCHCSSAVSAKSDKGAWLTISGALCIAKGKQFCAQGSNVNVAPPRDPEQGEYVP